jgi:crossover junction endodeoxyribonuclease RusA
MIQTISISLPLPSRRLSPNARVHWAERARLVKTARNRATMSFLCAEIPRSLGKRPLLLEWVFFWPDRRRRDDDNALASTKAYRDALAKHLGCDDTNFQTLGARMEHDPENPRLDLVIAYEK